MHLNPILIIYIISYKLYFQRLYSCLIPSLELRVTNFRSLQFLLICALFSLLPFFSRDHFLPPVEENPPGTIIFFIKNK
jgi:hypothetical protein